MINSVLSGLSFNLFADGHFNIISSFLFFYTAEFFHKKSGSGVQQARFCGRFSDNFLYFFLRDMFKRQKNRRLGESMSIKRINL